MVCMQHPHRLHRALARELTDPEKSAVNKAKHGSPSVPGGMVKSRAANLRRMVRRLVSRSAASGRD